MKRYYLFAGSHYYPAGGANDLVGTFETLELVKQAIDEDKAKDDLNHYPWEWYHVLDIQTGEVMDKV